MLEERLRATELGTLVAHEADDTALDLGGRIEDVLVHGEEILDIIPCLQEDTEDTVVLVAWGRGQTLSDLTLEHPRTAGDTLPIVQ